ncbi:alpha-tubulin N-acetyltransferase 1 [Caerostris darwini]|uniref:Alpha-tubulin N-acetyltransferase n=1 Tax=Caerostris darwini TaxID=1538125 RepID=A0AAV4PMP0_9ARAC|nr:alpha-tubulin N-acetyltransferase 1 [Caerostris darwini]
MEVGHNASNAPWDIKIKRRKEQLEIILERMGVASAQAQNLNSPITTLKKLINSSQQKVYIIRDVNESRFIIGMLKVGMKRLFVCDEVGAYHEVDPLCVLDFYVHESKQRCGFGHELFDAMLKAEGLEPSKLAIDRPSFKCLAFLEKHYNLKQPLVQNNNFVIYPGFLDNRPTTKPPIFLYGAKEDEKRNLNSTGQKINTVDTHSPMSDVLDSVKVPVSPHDIKGKTFHPSTGSFLKWNDAGQNKDCFQVKKLQDPTTSSCRQAISSCWNKEEKGWGVREVLHNYSTGEIESHGWCNNSNNGELTPISESTQKKWSRQLQSSWNIFGVKPLNYSPQHTNSVKE